jgi:hypothetical protein
MPNTSITREDILKMEAGREMDTLIAEKVMNGGRVARANHPEDDYWSFGGKNAIELPLFSTDISAAWEIINQTNKWDFMVGYDSDYPTPMYYCDLITDTDNFLSHAETAPLAICRSAMFAAVEEK